MKNHTIEHDNLMNADAIADASTKRVLRALFPAAFTPEAPATPKFGDIRDRIKTKQDVLSVLAVTEISFSDVDESEREYMRNLWWWRHIVKALNEGWEPDWSDSNQYKYYGWAYLSGNRSSGFVFDGSDYDCTVTCTDVGSRLCFKSKVLCEYAMEQFSDVFKSVMLP